MYFNIVVLLIASQSHIKVIHQVLQVLVHNVDDLKEILVDTEAKGIKTHKERDKKQFQEILPDINYY